MPFSPEQLSWFSPLSFDLELCTLRSVMQREWADRREWVGMELGGRESSHL